MAGRSLTILVLIKSFEGHIMKKTFAIITVGILFPMFVSAEFKLATIFSDHMVLQREKPVPVWGWADANEKVTIEFAGQTKSGTADEKGKWMVKLDPMAASDKAQALTVRSDKPEHKIMVSDILIGEVWLGSGQSNMVFTVKGSLNFEKEQAAAELPMIRLYKETSSGSKTPQEIGKGSWDVCSPATIGTHSAALYFMGRELHRELNVPVGLINSSVGGTPIENWIALEAQLNTPQTKDRAEAKAKGDASFDEVKAKAVYQKALAAWEANAAKAKAAGKPAPRKPSDPVVTAKTKSGVGGLFNGKIANLIPFAIRGAIWYQGEANTSDEGGVLYQYQLPLLVSDWRARWGDDYAFAWVQLPNFNRAGEGWPLVREAELKSLKLKNTGMAITIDIGEPGNIHPRNKQDVGHRLALWALGDVYGKKVNATSGPLPAGHEIKDSEIIVKFKYAESGLKAKDGELTGFVMAGEDKQWKTAVAKIVGDTVIVTSKDVAKPVAVRYAWEPNPTCNLYNGAGLPASPFRTDDWAPPVAAAKVKAAK